MNSPEKQTQFDHAYRAAMDLIDHEWLTAGKTKEELSQEKQLIELFDRLLASGRSQADILAAWEGQSTDEILREWSKMSPRELCILLAEDEDVIREAWRKAFDRLRPYACITFVRNGQEAVDEVRQGKVPYDLVVLDVNMPVMDGRTALVQIKQYAPNIKVLFLTGTLGRKEAQQLHKETGEPVVLKGKSVKNFVDLVEIIDLLVQGRSAGLQKYVGEEELYM